MSHGIILFTEGDAVLVVVGPVLHHATDVNEVFRQLQVAGIARGAVHLHHAHVVRRADGVACQFG